jgi:hypothetical protein
VSKFAIIFLIAIFSSIVLNPLFIKTGSPVNFRLISLALAEDSTDSNSGDSSDDSKDSSDDSKDSSDDSKDSSDDSKDSSDDSKDSSDETTDEMTDKTTDETTSDTTDEKCNEKVTTDETTGGDKSNKKCDEKGTTDETKSDDAGDKASDDNKKATDENKQSGTEKDDETTDAKADGKEYTLLDKITGDQTLLESVINDKTTDPGLVSTLVDQKQEETGNPAISETCNNGADNNVDGIIAIASNEDCAPSSTDTNANTNTNTNTTDTNANTNTNTNTTDTNANTNTNTNTTDTNANTTTIIPPASETCDTGIDNNATGTTNVACTPPVSSCDTDIDNNVTGTTNVDCPTLEPTVVIDSAEDQAGNDLSPGDLIVPQKVTFTFSLKASQTAEALEEEGPHDYGFECALDHESFSSCTSPMTYDMEAGKHNFVVRLVS